MSASSSTTLAVPISYHKSSIITTSHLPPTPTSTSSLEKNKARELLPASLQIPAQQQKYGSLGSSTPYLESLNNSRPVTPSQTTISPNDNDEGLYLLWTQQLLRERGFTPSTAGDDDDSSISDMSSVSSDEDDEEGLIDFIAEQNKLFSASSSPIPSTSAYSHRASMISRYSTIAAATEEETTRTKARQNPISTFFSSCFSSCF